MFRKGGRFKYHYGVQLESVTLRDGVASADTLYRVMWKKGDRVASSRDATPDGPRIEYKESLSLVCTMYRDAARGARFASKEATFTLLNHREGKPPSSARPLGAMT